MHISQDLAFHALKLKVFTVIPLLAAFVGGGSEGGMLAGVCWANWRFYGWCFLCDLNGDELYAQS